ncbi:uncharacterized protein LOC110465317 [Mizuhopecten yessoensis]|uniref:uncharacterized protein LOC110465317 n=1 Tax=Mizuhopecten yessoensis TaxID=6573 RepID=UPI000B4576A7|nr:uncharacterized protein LOC110465317 [Mizuhopecten yessoensis]
MEMSTKGDTYVHCLTCNVDFMCVHGGRNDCKRHIESASHNQWSKIKKKSNKDISNMLQTFRSEKDLIVTNAEVLMCEFISEMNLSLSTAKRMTETLKTMFPDSEIANGMKCGRNKATAIICDLADITKKSLAERMRTAPFTVSIDGSNDDTSKQFPLVVRTVDPESMTVDSELLSIPVCTESATGRNIFGLMDKELKARNIPWENCLSLGCDNASVMTGHKKGVFAFVKEQQPQVYLSGCPLHLVHIAARKAAEALSAIDEVLVDIYYYFNKSDKRKSEFRGTQSLYDVDQKKMLKHVCTRWLSIGRCIERLLQNWDPLKVYFKTQKELHDSKKGSKTSVEKSSQVCKPSSDKTIQAAEKPGKSQLGKEDTTKKSQTVKKPSSTCINKTHDSKKDDSMKVSVGGYMEQSYAEKKVEVIFDFIRSPTNKRYTIKVFDETLTCLQAEDPRIHTLRRSLHRLLMNILVRFVEPSAITGKAADEDDYHSRYNLKYNETIVIGEEAKQFIANKRENHLRDSRIEVFYTNVKCYFTNACNYIKAKLPNNEPLLKYAEVVDISLKETANQCALMYFIDRFPCLGAGVRKDVLIEQFTLYQSYNVEACVKDTQRIDETWREMGKIKDENDNALFTELSKVMLGIITIPHSSAHCERVFSTVRKNRTDQRSSLNDKTLESLLVLKGRAGKPDNRHHDRDILKRLKGAYYRSLKE